MAHTDESKTKTDRACGGCHECCIVPEIPALNKPANTACLHIISGSCTGCCGIYDQRPTACAQYRCSWLDGSLPAALKPSESGLLFDTVWLELDRRFYLHVGYELRAGAIDEHHDMLDQLARDYRAIIIVPFDRSEPCAFSDEHGLGILQQMFYAAHVRGGISHRMADGEFFQRLDGVMVPVPETNE